ncbi:MAG TPA: hypothetical protein VH583_18110 [Vicinamibacterales bacterium]|jgi:hypothetical protein
MTSRQLLGVVFGLSIVTASTALAHAQAPAPTPTTAVLVNLTVKPDVDRADVMKVLPEEVRETVKLYLDGRIQQWYSRSDGRGVVFILNAPDVASAKAAMEGLPLSKANLVNLEFTPLGPLSPLRVLVAPSPAGPGKDNR